MDSKQLVFRGSVDVIVDEDLNQKLESGTPLRIKFGIDPTAGRIHIGRASTIRHLKHFQDLGHEIHIIIGSFTAQIGDASDKDAERQVLSAEEVASNMQTYEQQLAKIFNTTNMTLHYNGEWFDKMELSEFFKLQQMFSLAQMIERDNFSLRFEQGNRIGLHEFSYALLQGYDSVAIKADVEIGGTDQLFNLLAGRTIQKAYEMEPQNIITYELLLGLDGRKMSTSWDNCVYIDDEPNDMFGKIMSIDDSLMWDYFRLATEISDEELLTVKTRINSGDDNRLLKAELAKHITAIYHDQEAANSAEQAFEAQFSKGQLPDDIEDFKTSLGSVNVIDLLHETKLTESKNEAKRLLEQGGIKINQVKVDQETVEIADGDVLQAGKRRFIRLKG